MRRLIAPATAGCAAMVLAACSPDAKDFQEEAEKYMESRGFSEEAQLLRISDVTCDEPASTAEDTRFACTGVDEAGSTWVFGIVITGETELQVIVPAGPDSTVPTTSGPPDSAAQATTLAEATTTATPTTTADITTTTPPAGTGG